MTVFKDIEDARKRLGVTPSAVAKRARVHPTTYRRALKGRNPHEKTLKRLLAALERIEAEQADLASRAKAISPEPQRKVA